MPAPASTYRLQFTSGFTLNDAAELTDYFTALGVGALYASPLLAAAPGSTHGYDLADPTRTCDERGGEAGRRRLTDRLRAAGLGFVVDIVCNHMGVDDPAANPWWWDVLKHGPASCRASFFDIDWSAGPIRLPVLADDGDDGAAALDELRLSDGVLCYHERRFPIAVGTGDGTAREIHSRQHYQLVSWRRGPAETNYRRFFNIDALACLRTEDADVFDALHAKILTWVRDGEVTGLRVDHPDGLADPGAYLRRLRSRAPGVWIVVEKVVSGDEQLPLSWPVDGTTGYEALRDVCGVFIDPAGRESLTAASHPDGPPAFTAVADDARRQVVTDLFPAESRRLAAVAVDALPELPADHVLQAVQELLIGFPVYRSYLPEHRAALDRAADRARAGRPDLTGTLDALCHAMVQAPDGHLAQRFQQTTGAVMAKGVEDTALYRYNRLVALNEVGGAPGAFGTTPAQFHAANAAREASWPATMTTLSTHDTKRSEDVRARLAVISELPDEYVGLVRRWSLRHRFPDAGLSPLAWQDLIGAWPVSDERLTAHLIKAAREARQCTDWLSIDPGYEGRVARWVGAVLGDTETRTEIAAFVARLNPLAWSNSLGQKLLQLAGPGVPDIYQGTELWDYSLVDPDNRRPVDFAHRRLLLSRLDTGGPPPVDASGAAKLLLVSRVLRLRRDRPGLWTGYTPVLAEGPAARHLIGFARGPRRDVVTLATRLPHGLVTNGGWADTRLPLPGRTAEWTDVLTGRRPETGVPRVADLLHHYPVALLVRDHLVTDQEAARPTTATPRGNE